jgi:hypothetical protein
MTTEAQRLGDLAVAEAIRNFDRYVRLPRGQGGEHHRTDRLTFAFELKVGDQAGFVFGCRRRVCVQGGAAAALTIMSRAPPCEARGRAGTGT